MHESKSSKFPGVLLTAFIAALLVGGAYREFDSASASRSDARAVGGVFEATPATSAEPSSEESPSNEIADFPQLG